MKSCQRDLDWIDAGLVLKIAYPESRSIHMQPVSDPDCKYSNPHHFQLPYPRVRLSSSPLSDIMYVEQSPVEST